ncbi:PH domain-containing protein [Streptomyces sp. P38-E01]|uniref:PH domain-containing protein n=1 Tax=Streptomyces tardus TaxID=2780544 RepID=A0A949JBE9_9ACTN|nr:PH domain-containing protein [Streptomyces tardus]MBU7596696.1 PH domain-containing protein [Streptomyces tardus]
MTTPETTYADRCYRSGAALLGGVLLLALLAWLGGDAVLRGEGRAPLTALAAVLALAPLIVAFTLRPAVFAGDERLLVRNPFRTISVPWGSVDSLRSGYSSEVVAEGTTYQLWSVPVSLRARKRAQRNTARVEAGKKPRGAMAALRGDDPENSGPQQATSDATMDELRQLADQHSEHTGRLSVRWAYEILAPAAVGALGLLLVLTLG